MPSTYLSAGRVIYVVLLVASLTYLPIRTFQQFEHGDYYETIHNIDYAIENIINENMERIASLSNEKFRQLSEAEKAEALRVVVEIEAKYLGMDTVPLYIADLESGSDQYVTHGLYKPVDRTIIIDRDYLGSDSMTIIKTVVHECYHAYQHECMKLLAGHGIDNSELLMFRTINQWRAGYNLVDNIDVYAKNDESSYELYRLSLTELTARKYSYARAEYYKNTILYVTPIE